MTSSPSRPLKTSSPISDRFYHFLLLFYPAEFRRVYYQEMTQTFRDCYRDALQQQGKSGVIRLWGLVLYDLATTVCIEHYRELVTRFKRFFFVPIEGKENIALIKQFNVAQQTDVGRKRESNEDNMICVVPGDAQIMAEKGALFVVADGMGGHEKGEVASELTVNTVRTAYYQDENNDIAVSLSQAVKAANTAVYQRVEQEGQTPGSKKSMGSTCIAAVVHDDMVYVANVGDSRAYIVRNGQVRQISQDHSWVAEQIRAGLLTEEQAREHENRNIITRCLGTKPDVEVDVFSEQVQEGDLLVLCTDGLSAVVSDEELGKIVQQFSPQESVQHLIERANEQGGPDNITAIVAQVSL